MTNSITIDVLDQEVLAKLEQLKAQGSNFGGPMAVIGRKVKTKIDLGFRASVTPWGAPWAPLKIRSGQPLRDTGRLQRSITYRTGKQGDEAYVDVGTNVAFAQVHQYGATIEPKTAKLLSFMTPLGRAFAKKVVIPSRPFMPIKGDALALPPAWAADIVDAVRNHLQRVLE